ncbi:MAG: LamG domain-containing protein, partial [Oceanipulchritudo sp.]
EPTPEPPPLAEDATVLEATHLWSLDDFIGDLALDEGTAGIPLIVSGTQISLGIGSTNSGIRFTGPHAGIGIASVESVNLAVQSELTISLWIRPGIISPHLTSVLYEQGGYWRGLNLILDQGWLIANGWNRPATESDWQGTTLLGGRLLVDQWNHVALVLDAGPGISPDGLKLYVNGRLAASGPGSQLWPHVDAIGIGQVRQSTVYQNRQVRELAPFQGGMDEISIWNDALSLEEIQSLILLSAE